MHDTACRNVNAGRIVVIGLNSQLTAVGRIDPVIIVPILSIVRGCPTQPDKVKSSNLTVPLIELAENHRFWFLVKL